MMKRIRWLMSLVVVLMVTSTALAQVPEPLVPGPKPLVLWPKDTGDQGPQHSDPNWQAAYWNNTTLSGVPNLQRSEANLDHDWGADSPGPSISPDGFSARWSRYIEEAPGTYRFTATSDDGIRVWVDDELIINEWYDHSASTVSADKSLASGHHLVVVEYYENTGFAVAKVSWTLVSTPATGWRGEYFDNTILSGTPTVVRDDPDIDFKWGTGPPASGVGSDGFSVRWTRHLDLPAGMYRFTMTVDDGGRLWVNNHHLVDAWQEQAATTYTGDIYVPGGAIPLKMEYYEQAGLAVAQLSWAEIGTTPPQPGTVIVDDTDPGFVKGGSSSGWHTAPEGYGGHLTWTRNNDRVRLNYNWARWYPSLVSGWYEVLVYIPERYTTTLRARYWIAHANGFTLRVVNQSANGNRWVSLGTYRFGGTEADYVSLSDVTYEPRLSRLIAFDAMKWEPC